MNGRGANEPPLQHARLRLRLPVAAAGGGGGDRQAELLFTGALAHGRAAATTETIRLVPFSILFWTRTVLYGQSGMCADWAHSVLGDESKRVRRDLRRIFLT
jgi:hypothetical protein